MHLTMLSSLFAKVEFIPMADFTLWACHAFPTRT